MTVIAPPSDPDERLLEEALVVVRAARERAPLDFLVAIALVLVAIAAVLFAIGLVVGGTAQGVTFDLAAEVLGAFLTVVLIDGLWKRQETGAAQGLRATETAIRARQRAADPLAPGDRQGWQAFIAEYRDLTGQRSLVGRLGAARSFARRAHDLELEAARLIGRPPVGPEFE
jgi:hypothetical protein